MGLKEIFQKQGGIKLLKQYWRSGVFFTAAGEFLLLGKSRTALEILRLSTQLKVKQKLAKKYKMKLEEFDRNYDANLPHNQSNKIWICWFQGMENAPVLVQKCYQSVKKNLPDKEVVLVTSDNMKNYVQFPLDIQKKIDQGIIKGAHLSDLLRLELLLRYGGTWIDATVYCSGNNIPDYMFASELFMFQCLKPGRDGHTSVISNWFITATTNNKILAATQYLLYDYWRNHDDVIDYFIFHELFQIVIEKYPKEWNKVIPFSNSTPHILLLRLFEDYDETVWNAIKEQTCFHKLSYKVEQGLALKEGTYFRKLIQSS